MKKFIASVICLLLLLSTVFFVYVGDFYHADVEAMETFAHADRAILVEKSEGHTAYIPESAEAGFIFYPGGKVEPEAYEPLMHSCAERGIMCVLVPMPFNLAVLDHDAAEDVLPLYPEVADWYIGGHSLGGAFAAAYLEGQHEKYKGLVLLAAYSASDLRDTKLDVLSVYGSEDRVLNREKYDSCLENLPADYSEIVIEGGNHAGFGLYGAQKGDGEAAISAQEQIALTAQAIESFIKN